MTGRPNRRWPAPGEVHRPESRLNPKGESGRQRFPFNNFTCCLTPFSRCFSSFDHSTCALSVSGRYLALDEIYHPLRAAFPNNSTRRGSFTRARAPHPRRDSHPLRRPIPGHLDRGHTRSILCKLQLGPPKGGPDFKFELLPLHSPLLRQSRLVSFPPLIDMLKFSGYPYLIRGQPKKEVFSIPEEQKTGWPKAPAGPSKRVTKPHTLEDLDAVPPLPFGPVPGGT